MDVNSKILILVGSVGLGGHVRSALSIAREIKKIHPNTFIVAGSGRGLDLLNNEEFKYFIYETGWEKDYVIKPSSLIQIGNIIKGCKPDVVHAFDFNSLLMASPYCIKYNIKLVYTICGGPLQKKTVPEFDSVVVFSEELKNELMSKYMFREEFISVNAARIDLDNVISKEISKASICQNLGISEDNKKNIVTITRIVKPKKKYILHVLKCAEMMQELGVRFILVGSFEDGNILKEIQAIADNINKDHDYKKVIITDTFKENANAYLQIADVLIGLGRTVLEAMAYGVPSIVVGESGYAAAVEKDSISRLSEANFSGRNYSNEKMEKRDPIATVNKINQILKMPLYTNRMIDESKKWILENMDTRKAADFYSHLYSKWGEKPHPDKWHIRRTLIDNFIYGAYKEIKYLCKKNGHAYKID